MSNGHGTCDRAVCGADDGHAEWLGPGTDSRHAAKICYAGAMASYLYERKVRAFDHTCFAETFRDELGENAERPAAEAGIEIEFILKLDRVKEILVRRG